MNSKNVLIASSLALGISLALSSSAVLAGKAITPIKHLIVVIGENVAFDTLYGAYKPAVGQTIHNLLSQGIIKVDGSRGVNYAAALQRRGFNPTRQYTVTPLRKEAYKTLPRPLQTGVLDSTTFKARAPTPDPRFPANLPSGPFQITKYVPYGSKNSSTGDPVHRFFQMWQQTGGNNLNHSLFTWVATTTGKGGDNGVDGANPNNTQQGGELMGFFNMSTGDAPLFKQLANNYALSDNFHQSMMGGTGANFFSIATGDVAVYRREGALKRPPVNQIEDPNPLAGTKNFYKQDGYSGGSYVNCANPKQAGVAAILKILEKNNRASNCAKGAYYLVNNYQPPYDIEGKAKKLGANQFVYPPQIVPTIGEALSAKKVGWRWYSAGRDKDDILKDAMYQRVRAFVSFQQTDIIGIFQGVDDIFAAAADEAFSRLRFKLPSIHLPNPTDIINLHRSQAVDKKTYEIMQRAIYNKSGDPLNASARIVNTRELHSHLKGLTSFLKDVKNNTLPAVSFVVPKNLDSGHPGYSSTVRYEAFIRTLLAAVKAKPALWADTAIIITTDEGGGYFDTGVIQTLDFFGDGPRIPFLVVSPYAKKGYVDHVYHDHASILKFIEYNWQLPPLSKRSRDNLPNPIGVANNPYLPANQPAIGDLTSLFKF